MVRAIDRFGGVSNLPPQQAKFWADKAKNGEADESLDSGIYIFKNKGGVKEIVIMSLDPPQGHIKR